jgi:adenylate cyclase
MGGSPQRAQVRFPLWSKLLVAAILLAGVPAIVIGVVSFLRSSDVLQQQVRSLQYSVTQHVADQMVSSLDGAKTELATIAKLLADPLMGDDAKESLIKSMISASPLLDHVAIYDDKGVLIDRMIAQRDMNLPATSPRLTRLDPESATLGEPIATASEVRLPMVIAIPGNKGATGYVASLVSLAPIQTLVESIAHDRFPSQSESLFMVDAQLREVVGVDERAALRLTKRDNQGIFAVTGPAVVQEGVGHFGPEYPMADGRSMVGTVTPLFGWPLSVVAQQERSIAYAELTMLRNRVILVVGIALALASLLALALAHAVTAPVRDLVIFTKELAARRFAERVKITSRDELATLGVALNAAAYELAESEATIRKQYEIRADLGRYLPAPIVEKIVAREQDMALGGQRCDITVVFADVVAFTPLTGRLEPETVVAILNELFTILSEIVFRHNGMIDKFIGDSMMALWGAPEPATDHAHRAVTAALEMQKWLGFGRKRWKDRHGIEIEIAIGVNSGAAVVGNIGSKTRMEYTAIGECVNVAARVESIARPGQVLITQATKDLLSEDFDIALVGERQLPGRQVATVLFEVVG